MAEKKIEEFKEISIKKTKHDNINSITDDIDLGGEKDFIILFINMIYFI